MIRGNGGAEQFASWAHDHAPALSRFALALTGDANAADRLVRSALSRTYAAWPVLARRDDPDVYARRIVLHAHVSAERRSRERRPDASRDDGLGSALLGLPPRRRAVVVSRYCEGRSVRQTAALLDCSLGTVKSHAAKTLAELRPALGSERSGPDDVASALRDAYTHIPSSSTEPEAFIAQAVTDGKGRRRRDLQTRLGVFVAVCVIALAGMVGLSRGGRHIGHFGGPGALITTPRPFPATRAV